MINLRNQQQHRQSIRTNLRHVPKPKDNALLLPILAKLSIAICAIVILFCLIKGSKPNQAIADQYPEESKSNQVVSNFQLELHDIHSSNHDLPVIPLVHNQPTCEKTKKQQLQESLKNIQIFQLIRASVKPQQEKLQQYFMKVQPLSVVKHPKFTSPIQGTPEKILNFDFWNLFKSNEEEQYKDVQRIFDPRNKNSWNSSGKYLTVVCNQPIKPIFLRLKLNENYEEQSLHIYGISVVDSVLVNKNTFESTFILQAKVKGGQNKIQCDQPACVMEYSMIMLILDPMEIIQLQIYSHKEPYHSYNFNNPYN